MDSNELNTTDISAFKQLNSTEKRLLSTHLNNINEGETIPISFRISKDLCNFIIKYFPSSSRSQAFRDALKFLVFELAENEDIQTILENAKRGKK